MSEADVSGRDTERIAAGIRPGSAAAECVKHLKRIRPVNASAAIAAPDPATLPLLGEAKNWVADAIVDLERLKRGDIAAADLEDAMLHGPQAPARRCWLALSPRL